MIRRITWKILQILQRRHLKKVLKFIDFTLKVLLRANWGASIPKNGCQFTFGAIKIYWKYVLKKTLTRKWWKKNCYNTENLHILPSIKVSFLACVPASLEKYENKFHFYSQALPITHFQKLSMSCFSFFLKFTHFQGFQGPVCIPALVQTSESAHSTEEKTE